MNWGIKIIIVIVAFMAFIVTLVVKMAAPHKADPLIEENYYERGQSFDQDYDASHAAEEDQMLPSIKTGSGGISIDFPRQVNSRIILRSLADATRDTTLAIQQAKNIIIPISVLQRGSWLLRIEYSRGEKEYVYQDKIRIP